MLPVLNVLFVGVCVSVSVTDKIMRGVLHCLKSYFSLGRLGMKVEAFHVTASELQIDNEFEFLTK